MGLYGERVLPRMLDVVMNTKEIRRVRGEVCAALAGDVLEIGFGSGRNLGFLPSSVRRLVVVDPSDGAARIAGPRIESAPFPVERIGLDGQRLPLDDHSVDAVLSTWTLCTIPDPVAAVREVGRVLRPGGVFHFVEHGASPDARVRRRQDRINGWSVRMVGGCNLNREIPSIIQEGGLSILEVETFHLKGDLETSGWTFQGSAVLAG